MNKRNLVVVLIIALVILGFIFVLTDSKQRNSIISLVSPSPEPTSSIQNSPASSVFSPLPSNNTSLPSPSSSTQPVLIDKVKIYLVAIDDGGKSGVRFGCNDSLVAVNQSITPTQTPLKASFEKLLSIKDQYYGQSGLYNSLYKSNLKVDSVNIKDGKAVINLSGQVMMGGTCDNPRFENQLKSTALQFSTVKEAEIYINNKLLSEVVSSR